MKVFINADNVLSLNAATPPVIKRFPLAARDAFHILPLAFAQPLQIAVC